MSPDPKFVSILVSFPPNLFVLRMSPFKKKKKKHPSFEFWQNSKEKALKWLEPKSHSHVNLQKQIPYPFSCWPLALKWFILGAKQ